MAIFEEKDRTQLSKLRSKLTRLDRRVKELEVLNRLSRVMASTLDVEEILKIIIDEATSLTGANQGSIMVIDKDSDRGMRTLIRCMTEKERGIIHKVGSNVTGWILKNKKPLLVDDIKSDIRFTGLKLKDHQFKSIMSIPVILRGEIIGAINLINTTNGRVFCDEDIRLVSTIASQATPVIENARLHEKLARENVYLKKEVQRRYRFSEIIGKSPEMKKLFTVMERVIPSEAQILLEGESGTGKELVARAIHYSGPRKNNRFVPVDCGAIPTSLLESELFGYTKGAFTGADKDKKGLFEESHGGTLFLDEVSNTSLAIQAKLLRAIQEKEIRPIGKTESKKIDARIISATSTNLKKKIVEGKFREDLYYRLNVISITLPPLRERNADIPLLANHFMQKFREIADRKNIKGYTAETMTLFERYHWPGNIRQLENVVERAITLAGDDVELITPDLLPEEITKSKEIVDITKISDTGSLKKVLERVKQQMILKALDKYKGNRTKAAQSLGISRPGLKRMIDRMGESQKL